ncbi:hypothetical protein BSL78_02973 [Apostichopus japonicus]|uniref:Zinc finger PHD-type domain-containing protein n=1 Tax=Stichopus japonicus TaxID=307972 RepID=A0A2G8LII1_STIJA|nr:hypothetical protein BSL78_02973 [Apostichopus japonicus]
MWLPHLGLSEAERLMLLERKWLNDLVINAGQKILKEASGVGGLQDTLLMQCSGFVAESAEFVQVVNLTNSHWIVLSNIGMTGPNVRIFDSKVPKRLSYPLDTVKAAACLLQTKDDQIFLHVMNVTQQKSGSSCGVFALAFAASLCSGQDPTKLHYDEDIIWQGLFENLSNRQMTPFGIKSTTRTVKKKRLRVVTERIYCTCRRPDDGGKMAQCVVCEDWFHETCIGRIPKREYHCHYCQRRLSKHKVKASKKNG